jgi:hypothetical protein
MQLLLSSHTFVSHTPIIFSYTNLLQLFQYYITGRYAPSAPTVDTTTKCCYFIKSPGDCGECLLLIVECMMSIHPCCYIRAVCSLQGDAPLFNWGSSRSLYKKWWLTQLYMDPLRWLMVIFHGWNDVGCLQWRGGLLLLLTEEYHGSCQIC